MLSIIIPCYNTRECITALYESIKNILGHNKIAYEIIFIDDKSPQKDYEVVKHLSQIDSSVKLIKFVRNFGQQNAISAGLKISKGDWVIVMDADMQDDPIYIPQLYSKVQEGYDIVFAKRINRKHSFIKILESRVYHLCFNWLTGMDTDTTIGNYGIYSRKVVNEFNNMNEQFRSFGLLIKWMGFNCAYMDVEHGKRYTGKSSYNFHKGIILAFNAMIAFSQRPLKFAVLIGFGITFISIIVSIIFIIRWLLGEVAIIGWTSIVLSIWLIGGLNIIILGIVGLYIGKIFEETKQRPHYIIDYMVNINET
ncbi:MAG: glycosyltransferase family 2 protein [Candidatus Cloacimonas sp.]|jgi:dolichol-phosphate mannosyltransferase|nr:glycosyltransferase family 2 protein [Candidatus Cloacimonas sp.]